MSLTDLLVGVSLMVVIGGGALTTLFWIIFWMKR